MPPVVARPRILACLAAAGAAVAALSLSDRAPSLVEHGLWTGRDLYHRLEMRTGFDLLHRSDIPLAWETAGHIVLWAVVAGLATLALGRRRSIVPIVVVAVLASIGVEVAQVMWSATREAEWGDVVANTVGATAGATGARLLDHLGTGIGRTAARVRSSGAPTP